MHFLSLKPSKLLSVSEGQNLNYKLAVSFGIEWFTLDICTDTFFSLDSNGICSSKPCWAMVIKWLKHIKSKILSNINHSKILYDLPPKILEIKAKINKWDLIKLKSFCTTKETIR